jgi:methylamine dehydrogenase accessory protein MauD
VSGVVASQVLLWIAVLVLTVIVIALARQIGVLHARIAPIGALRADHGPEVGEQAPKLTVRTLGGITIAIGEPLPEGLSQLLLFVSPDCPICKNLIPVAKAFSRDEKLAVLYVSDGEDAVLRQMVERYGLEQVPFANSPEVGFKFGVGKLPYAVLIDHHGTIVSSGLVNSREHLESLVVAQQMGVPSVQAYLQRQQTEAESAKVTLSSGASR